VKSPERKLVLLIDELNMLGKPLDHDASAFLKKVFLDPVNRYLVYTTHVPLDINEHSLGGISNREGVTIDLPISTDPKELQKMFQQGTNVVYKSDVVFYLGIPALIFSMKRGDFNADVRVQMCLDLMRDKYGQFNDLGISELLKSFLDLFLSGSKGLDIKKEVQSFDQFSVIESNHKQRFPLKFAAAIISALNRKSYVSESIFSRMRILINDLIPSSFDLPDSGTEWEYVIELAVLLHCLKAQLFQSHFAFMLRDIKVEIAEFDRLPDEVDTLDGAYKYIQDFTFNKKPGTLMFFKPVNQKFERLDGLIAFKQPNGQLKVIGYQVERGEVKLSYDSIHSLYEGVSWLDQVFWVQGKPREGTKKEYGKIHFVKIDELRQLLGYSLEPFIPALLDSLITK
jgi:hypothetical protein